MQKKFIVLSVIGALVVWQAWRVSIDAGVFTPVEAKPFGECVKMHGPPGSEDINIDPVNRVAFVSAGNGREVFEYYRDPSPGRPANGDIWILNLALADSEPTPLNVEIEGAFHPHGIDLLHLEDGTRELYVINHPSRDEHEVLIFDVGADHNLSLKKRVHSEALISPNDIKAIDRGRFFVTNDHGSPSSSAMARIEEYLGLARSSVVYYDGVVASFIIEGLKSANGITLSSDQQTLYVGEALGRSVKRFERQSSIRDWTFAERLDLDTAVDNLEWSSDGRLLAGAHPKIFPFLDHASDADALSPSQVVAIDVDRTPMVAKTLYMNDGSELSGSSVAAMLGGTMLIGAVFETHFLRCDKD